jgi:uncharacterized protein with HEPN domain
MSRRHEPAILKEALFHLDILNTYLDRGDLNDTLILDGVCMRLSSAIEALSRLPDGRAEALFEEQWRAMWGTRNRIAHGYVWVNHEIIDQAVHENVPEIIAILRRELGD